MPKRSRTKKPARKQPSADPNRAAFDVLQSVIQSGEAEGKNPLAVALGRLGGLKGGRTRADRLTPEQRQESARHAAKTRWAK
jgi:hypothetical protein